MKVKCRITKTIFKKDDYRIFGVIPMDDKCKELKLNRFGNFTIAGNYPYLDEGQEYIMELQEGKTDKYGTSYVVKSVPSMEIEELTDETELGYLERITTPQQAQYIHEAYPDFIRRILKGEEDSINVKNIYNVGEYRMNVYIREINTKFKYFSIIALYPQYTLSIDEAKTLSAEMKDIETIKENLDNQPYATLIQVLGRGFEKVDKMVLEYDGNYRTSDQRVEFFLLWLLSRNELDGNTRIYANALTSHIKEYDKALLPLVKEVAIKSDRIYFDNESKDMARMDTYMAECNIADFVVCRTRKENPIGLEVGYKNFIEVDGFKLSQKQQGLLTNAIKYDFSILLGFSGTGKSSSVVGLIKMLEANHLTYTLLAPTGKAAKRLSECTGRTASTIHRRIGEQITSNYVIVDEFSMVDVALCNALFQCVSDDTRVVLVGDNAQLSSIGCGNVFTDMIESGVIPTAFLDEVFRYNEGGMLKVATDIRNGKSYFESDAPVQKFGKNFTYIQANNDTAFDILMEEYEKALKSHKPNEIMVLTPFNVGECGTYNINNIIQAHVNPPKPKQLVMTREINNIEIKFRIGDYVLNTKNDYKAITLEEYERLQKVNDIIEEWEFEENEDIELCNFSDTPSYETIYNGDTGIIRKITEKYLVVEIDEKMIVFEKNKLNQLLLSYCITTHKSQGSQAQYVINMSLPMHSRMLTSNLLYVADTRSGKTMIEIGDMTTIKNAIKIKDEVERNTFLLDAIKEKVAQYLLLDKGCANDNEGEVAITLEDNNIIDNVEIVESNGNLVNSQTGEIIE